MKEEDNILKKCGKKNPFKVPEGYFENFKDNLMDKLPEKENSIHKISTWQRIKPWIYMTAMFCGLMLSVKVFLEKPDTEKQMFTTSQTAQLSDEEVESIVDNSMIDDYSLYTYLTDADN